MAIEKFLRKFPLAYCINILDIFKSLGNTSIEVFITFETNILNP